MLEVEVKLGIQSYTVTIGSGIVGRLSKVVREKAAFNRLFIFYDAQFYALHGHTLAADLKYPGEMIEMVLPGGEKSKSTAELNRLYSFLLSEKISRSDFVVACGGGVISDLVGFAAATALRGIRWGIVPTTLLSMVDASIGGKTGINHPSGKNLIGAFWQPAFVWSDTRFLKTLPSREMTSGMGEIVKYAGLARKPILDLLRTHIGRKSQLPERVLTRLIALSVEYKSSIVAKDERDSGKRMVLNLGHTFGHAFETIAGYGKLRHGEAIILGLYAACDLSVRLMPKSAGRLESYRKLVETYLRSVPHYRVSPQKVIDAMALDKKRSGKTLKFVLLERPGKPIIVENVAEDAVKESVLATLDAYKTIGGTK